MIGRGRRSVVAQLIASQRGSALFCEDLLHPFEFEALLTDLWEGPPVEAQGAIQLAPGYMA